MLAKYHIFQSAGILRLGLHQLHETICDLIPLPVDHDIENAGERDGLRAEHDALIHMQTDVAIGERLAAEHHDGLPVDLSHFCFKHLKVDDDELGRRRHVQVEMQGLDRLLLEVGDAFEERALARQCVISCLELIIELCRFILHIAIIGAREELSRVVVDEFAEELHNIGDFQVHVAVLDF